MNKETSYSELRASLKSHLDDVCDDHTPLLVKRRNGENVVMISEEDYTSLEETAYLSSSPTNLHRLLSAKDRKNGFDLEDIKRELKD